jgi:hypothetical protein
MALTEDQATQLADFVTAEVQAGRMTEAQGRAYVAQTVRDANRLSAVMSETPPTNHAEGFVAPDDVQIAIEVLRAQGLSRNQAAERLATRGLDGLGEAIQQRKSELLADHVRRSEAIAADAPDARRAQAQAELQAAEALKRDSLLAREYIVNAGLMPENLANELTDEESVSLAFDSQDRDPEANDLAANLAAANRPRPEPWTPNGNNQ